MSSTGDFIRRPSSTQSIRVGDEVSFKAAKIGRTIAGEVIEVIPPGSLPSPDLLEAISATGQRSFKRSDHWRYAVRDKDSGSVYIPYGASAVAADITSFRLEAHTIDEVAAITKKQLDDIRIGRGDVKKLQAISRDIKTRLEEFDQVLARLDSR
jgi:hypothetical protein